jgi:hypothetical protein
MNHHYYRCDGFLPSGIVDARQECDSGQRNGPRGGRPPVVVRPSAESADAPYGPSPVIRCHGLERRADCRHVAYARGAGRCAGGSRGRATPGELGRAEKQQLSALRSGASKSQETMATAGRAFGRRRGSRDGGFFTGRAACWPARPTALSSLACALALRVSVRKTRKPSCDATRAAHLQA